MVTTNDPDFAAKIKMYGLHGLSRDAWSRFSDEGYRHYQVHFPGFKYNMMDLQAAIGIHQFARVDRWLTRREEIWRHYDASFADLPVDTPTPDEPQTVHARHLYTLMVDEARCGISRDDFMAELHRRRIGTGVHYLGVHLHPYYRARWGYRPEDFPNATWLSERTVSLPLSPGLADDDVEDVVEAVRATIRGG